MYVGTQICFQIESIVKSTTKDVTNNRMLQNEKGIECETRKREVENTKVGRFGRFMKLLEVKAHYHEFEVCHVSSWVRIIMN